MPLRSDSVLVEQKKLPVGCFPCSPVQVRGNRIEVCCRARFQRVRFRLFWRRLLQWGVCMGNTEFQCRVGCGACCIAPSISTCIPGMQDGKPAGVRCVQLDTEHRCRLFGQPERPQVCLQFLAEESVCGASREEAVQYLRLLEVETG
ncbi:YkgJ family cysteine cluster protein [Aestuariirhabdus sp. LZHN29]|uniref:YkgJ family cysteine cluster protein n=1 Tax=Aestuariirhabdus sp. LZHN29 TaxID=3417462 RepID=UPI003CF7BE8C